ncbi:glycoside hydrolase family 16 protein [Lentinula guzmanii]|uniref:Glycoside hydrolase family 16 protein n=1 Tax=Lentinula guzmanii TaxID=2804957 RepID=A0AA38J5Q8_9AGAR|nr:glycoside hydrolase family 16 protein [Lentinula guzmanii]
MIFVGVVISAVKCFLDYRNVPMITGIYAWFLMKASIARWEVDMSGFGNGEFEMTTDSENNSFVANGHLYILPTLTSDSIPMADILDGHVYNISGCTTTLPGPILHRFFLNTATSLNETAIGSNTSTLKLTIKRVLRARLSTRKTASMKFGRVDVVAKIPTGDWTTHTGRGPLSGEIDIMEARGNGPSYPKQGTDYVRGSLNWLELNINEAFWDRGDFPAVVQNGSEVVALQDPWINGTKAAHLINTLNLAAMRDFLEAQDQWYPTWPTNPDERAFVIDSVKMYEQC